MPKYASPEQPLSAAAKKAVDVLGANMIRGSIVRVLSQHPEGMTSGMIERELNAQYQTVFRHLQALEAAGVVSTAAAGSRHGRRVVYVLDQDALIATIADYQSYLLGN